MNNKHHQFSQSQMPGSHPAAHMFESFHQSPHGEFKPLFYNPFEVKHRKRTTKKQFKVLERMFHENQKPSANVRKLLSEQLDMSPRGVQVWFQNRRAKHKLQQKQENVHLAQSETDATNSGVDCITSDTFGDGYSSYDHNQRIQIPVAHEVGWMYPTKSPQPGKKRYYNSIYGQKTESKYDDQQSIPTLAAASIGLENCRTPEDLAGSFTDMPDYSTTSSGLPISVRKRTASMPNIFVDNTDSYSYMMQDYSSNDDKKPFDGRPVNDSGEIPESLKRQRTGSVPIAKLSVEKNWPYYDDSIYPASHEHVDVNDYTKTLAPVHPFLAFARPYLPQKVTYLKSDQETATSPPGPPSSRKNSMSSGSLFNSYTGFEDKPRETDLDPSGIDFYCSGGGKAGLDKNGSMDHLGPLHQGQHGSTKDTGNHQIGPDKKLFIFESECHRPGNFEGFPKNKDNMSQDIINQENLESDDITFLDGFSTRGGFDSFMDM